MPEQPAPIHWMNDELAEIEQLGLSRRRRVVTRRVAGQVTIDGVEYIDFASNDYLGLASHPEVVQASRQAVEKWGWGSGASSLITGFTQAHADLEEKIAQFEGTEAALVFPSGFAANLGTLAALAGTEDLILSERRNHASLIDGCRLSKATVRIFDGTQLEKMEPLLADAGRFRRRLIVTDSVFSMDGDIAPLQELADIADRFDALLYVDEAHATGILGPNGRGACEELGIEHRVPFRMGTLSKGVGSVGGFIAGRREVIDWLVNKVRPYVYSTNMPAAAAAASTRSLEIIRQHPEWRQSLRIMASQFREACSERGWCTSTSRTQIIPIIVGEPAPTLELARWLASRGFWCPAIRPPTVPIGTCRLRISLSLNHKVFSINGLLHALQAQTEACLIRK
jgi:8-amino-7-oxononanoate synthase